MNATLAKWAQALFKLVLYLTRPIFGLALPRSTTLYIAGRHLYDTTGRKVILRGVNLPLLDDWNFPGSDKLTDLERTGANAVRIEWYKDYGNPARPAYTVTDLDNFLTKCKTNRMIPILGLWDLTCNDNSGLLNSQLISWWTTNPVLGVLKKHQQYLIINLANELGVYRWAGNQAAALANFKNAYKSAITSIRSAGLNMPIMIDAPDCGSSLHAFTTIGRDLITHDPRHNLLLSVHAYWADYDGTGEIQNAVNAKLPIVFGEVANKQANEGDECYFGLDGTNQGHSPPTGFRYQSLLATLKDNDIGWLAWGWWPDACASRQMSGNGSFGSLTAYGQDIVNNAAYGLKTTAIRSSMFA
jgi:mannan endo-1,4-beta-mannosidase